MMRRPRHPAGLAVPARFLAAVLLAAPGLAAAIGPAACPAQPPLSLAALAQPAAPMDTDALRVPTAAGGTADPAAEARLRAEERAAFERILAERAAVAAPAPIRLALAPAERAAIEADAPPVPGGPLRVGARIALDQAVDFSGLAAAAPARGSLPLGGGVAGRADDGGMVWEAALSSAGARALRVEFGAIRLAPGVELHVYNEAGQVFGPYAGEGPDGSGAFWSPSVFGDEVRIHVRAPDAAALAASRLALAGLMHLGARVGPLHEAIAAGYVGGPAPSDVGYCGVQVPDCTVNGVCATATNPGLTAAADAIAHIQFVKDGESYICSGAYVAQSGNAPQAPYFLTANHCFSTQASAASLEAFFRYRTASCDGGCPTLGTLPRVNGATLVASGARPTQADYTLVRLSGFPAGGARLIGWAVSPPAEGAYLIHMGHPAGSPLAYSYRRVRRNNPSVPHWNEAPEPTFTYSGLASTSQDWIGATAGGSSGGPALLLPASGDAYLVGQLLGFAAFTAEAPCDPNEQATIDGAWSATFPYVRRYVYERIFRGSFD